jgi:hypothetical protein
MSHESIAHTVPVAAAAEEPLASHALLVWDLVAGAISREGREEKTLYSFFLFCESHHITQPQSKRSQTWEIRNMRPRRLGGLPGCQRMLHLGGALDRNSTAQMK